jgi:hypothetical protein
MNQVGVAPPKAAWQALAGEAKLNGRWTLVYLSSKAAASDLRAI